MLKRKSDLIRLVRHAKILVAISRTPIWPLALGRPAHDQLWPQHDHFRLGGAFEFRMVMRQTRRFLSDSSAVLVDA